MTDKILMPRELTAENGAKALLIGEFSEGIELECPECGGDSPSDESENICTACGGSGVYIEKIPVRWTTIKAIYRKTVKHLGKELTQ